MVVTLVFFTIGVDLLWVGVGNGWVDLWWPHWCSLPLGSICDGLVWEMVGSICGGHTGVLYYWGRSVMGW